MTTKTDKDKPKEVDYNKRANIALGVGAFAVIVLPFVFSQFSIGLDFTETGQIGDTIGGITAPFVGLVGAMLVYYSFKQQMIANKIQVDSISDIKNENLDNHLINVVNDLSNKCEDMIDLFAFDIGKKNLQYITLDGRDGFVEFFKYYCSKNPNNRESVGVQRGSFKQLNQCVSLLLMTINKISSKDLKLIYLRLYESQIHHIIYSELREFEGEINKEYIHYKDIMFAKENDKAFRKFEAFIDFSD
tara:strand:- start:972 stop:1709 length:738 start_codon:yes stop_codon:yes gene_type:complete